MKGFIEEMAEWLIASIDGQDDPKEGAICVLIGIVTYVFCFCASIFFIVFMIKNLSIVTALLILIGIPVQVLLLIVLAMYIEAFAMLIDEIDRQKK